MGSDTVSTAGGRKKRPRVTQKCGDEVEDSCQHGDEPEERLHSKRKERKKNEKGKKDAVEEKKRDHLSPPTVNMAVAGSIVDNTQSLELATRLAGQIARAAAIFCVDEVVVFDGKSSDEYEEEAASGEGDGSYEDGARFLVRLLQYLETPQYLRRRLFPMHQSLKFVGMLPPLDAPHHLRKHEWSPFREGLTLEGDNSNGTLVDVGLSKNVLVRERLEPGKRVTVAMGSERDINEGIFRKIVPSSSPREDLGMYWGYKVRYAPNLSSVFSKSPYKGGYDCTIGTSEHGKVISSSELVLPKFRHLLIAFGGLAGLEECIEEDSKLKGKKVDDVFSSYLNTCPHQGSRTIRTEEAILISLQYFQEPLRRAIQCSHVGGQSQQ